VTPRHPPCAFLRSASRSRTTPSRQDRLSPHHSSLLNVQHRTLAVFQQQAARRSTYDCRSTVDRQPRRTGSRLCTSPVSLSVLLKEPGPTNLPPSKNGPTFAGPSGAQTRDRASYSQAPPRTVCALTVRIVVAPAPSAEGALPL